ncbi:MAG: hypothetical protein OXG27_10165, partial [Chloroflexi bacterium]|nr:hypothetical protein [Chloroflexota bacterium]
MTFMQLEPATSYVIEVYEGDWRSRNPSVVYVRTEPVPDDWWALNIARDVKVAVFGNRLLIFWDCLPAALRTPLLPPRVLRTAAQ